MPRGKGKEAQQHTPQRLLQALPRELLERGSPDRSGLMCNICVEMSGVWVDNTVL